MQKILTDEKFGENIRKIRRNRGLSQGQITVKMQLLGSTIVRSTFSQIESGKGNIFVSDLVGLKQIFDVEYSAFFEGIGTER